MQQVIIVLLVVLAIVIAMRCFSEKMMIGGATLVKQFPYIKEWHIDKQIHHMMGNLKRYNWQQRISHNPYKLRRVNVKNLYEGRYVLINNYRQDYDDFNKLSDMFQEKCRVKCQVKGKINPYDYWVRFKHKLPKDRKEQRNVIWKESFECTSHRPNILYTLIKMYNAKSVIDFTAGWGDRLIASIAADVKYCGIDNNPCLFENYAKIIKFFGAKNKTMIQGDTTKVKVDGKFDLCFTSPPYFDYEKYTTSFDGEKQWFDTFLKVCLKKYWKNIKIGGHMCINIHHTNDKQRYVYWMLDYVKEFADSEYLGVISYMMKKKKPQPIWIWKKLK